MCTCWGFPWYNKADVMCAILRWDWDDTSVPLRRHIWENLSISPPPRERHAWYGSLLNENFPFVCITTERLRTRRATIQKNYDFILDHLETEFEFLDQLISRDVFASEAIDEIRSEKSKRRRIEIVLTHLKYVDDRAYGIFLETLKASNQKHIVNFINGKFCDLLWKIDFITENINYKHF